MAEYSEHEKAAALDDLVLALWSDEDGYIDFSKPDHMCIDAHPTVTPETLAVMRSIVEGIER